MFELATGYLALVAVFAASMGAAGDDCPGWIGDRARDRATALSQNGS